MAARVFPQSTNKILREEIFSPFMSFERERFTIWMKSLVCHAYGLTAFDSNGEVVYRIDNYGRKCCNEVYLMDLGGRVLFTIIRKGLQILGRWYGYRGNITKLNKEKPCFQVKRCCRFFTGNLVCEITAGIDKYWVAKLTENIPFRIVDIDGDIVAEVKHKQSSLGMRLGDDVWSLIVEPNIDHSLIMAIITVYGLIHKKL